MEVIVEAGLEGVIRTMEAGAGGVIMTLEAGAGEGTTMGGTRAVEAMMLVVVGVVKPAVSRVGKVSAGVDAEHTTATAARAMTLTEAALMVVAAAAVAVMAAIRLREEAMAVMVAIGNHHQTIRVDAAGAALWSVIREAGTSSRS
jgi:hypothetical protein